MMRPIFLLVFGLLVVSGLIAGRGYGRTSSYLAPQAILSIATWEGREKALAGALQHFPLSDRSLQKAAAQLLYREENDPHWADNDEQLSFRHYEESLINLNKRIALMYDNPLAWHALAWSNYDPDSDFADWLRHQTEAVNILLKMFDDSREVPQGIAAEMLGKLIEDCGLKPEIGTCPIIEPQRERIRSIIRQRILDSPDQKNGLLIAALGYCGTEADVVFLQRLADQQSARDIPKKTKRRLLFRSRSFS